MSPILRLSGLCAAVLTLVALGLSCGMPVTDRVEVNGHVRLASGEPLAGVRIHYIPPEDPSFYGEDVFTDAEGRYVFWLGEFYEAHNWRHFRMTPYLVGYTFTPLQVDAIAAEEVQTYDFTATPVAGFSAEYYVLVWSWLESW